MKATSTRKKLTTKIEVKENSFPVVAIGASAGGLEAMMELLKYLPSETGMAYIYVQHLSPDHKSLLTEILSKKTKMKVQEIDDMDKIQPDNLFVIPYNKGIEVTDGHIKLIPRSETSAAISIDILFSSLALAQKERVIGIVLSGSASDGSLGIKDIKLEGGLTFAQDDTAKFHSMPHSAIATGAVDFILSPKEIALELARLSKHPLIKTNGVKNGVEDLIDNNNPDLKNILNQLHKATGVDFGLYKMTTIKRRITRRMLLYKINTLREYAKLLSEKNEETDILYQDLLINVTSFFRDTDSHKYLKENLFPKLLKRKKTGESLRIWVPACASGEEAYSIAMMLLEIQGSQTTNITVQIFATDLSPQAISKARNGIYTEQELKTVSPKRIQRFFIKDNGSFRVNKAIREMCVFASHNILHDPPFSRLDFISCCNLFIYFDTVAQKKALHTFHYALNDNGFLMLGKSENISQSTKFFTDYNKKYKIFSRKINSAIRTLPTHLPRYAQQGIPEKNKPALTKNNILKNSSVNVSGLDNAIDALLVSEFMPASVVINHQMEIVQFRGTTDVFLTHPKGKATFNILKMARPEIAFELRNAISKVIKTKQRIRKSGIEIRIHADVKIISVEIVPLKIESNEPLLLILFTEQEQTEIFSQHAIGEKSNSLAKDRRIKKLELELAAAHADALALAQEQESYTEELQSANEEVVSSNEELQTLNEELETSKEEIESANEELITTNQELQTRNDLLNEAYGYSEAVFATIHEPMLVLDKNLRVKSANKTFYKTFNVNEKETEGMLLYDLGNKQWNIPRLRELLEDILPRNTHFHDFEITHTFLSIGEKVMLLNARRIIQKMNHEELILLAISDITEQANARRKIEESEHRYQELIYSSPSLISICKGEKMIIEIANDAMLKSWGKGNIIGKSVFEAVPECIDQGFDKLLLGVYKTGQPVQAFEVPVTLLRNGKNELVYYNFIYQAQRKKNGEIEGVATIAYEVTPLALANINLKESEEKYRTLLTSIDQGFTLCEIIRNKEGKAIDFYILEVNPTYEEQTGLSKETVIGKRIIQTFPSLTKTLETYAAVVDNQCPEFIENYFEDTDRWFENKAYPVGIDRFTVLFRDITERKKAEEKIKASEEKFRQLSELMPQKVWTADAKGHKIYFNKTLLDFAGMSFEELKGDGWKKMIHPDDWEEDEKKWNESVRTAKKYQSESRFLRKDGKYIWHLTVAVPLKDEKNNIKLWIGSKTEIHEQRKQKEMLEEAVTKRTAELKQANQELVNINKELEAFTYVSSHDLQEPLRKIRTIAGRILEKENQNLSDNGKNYFRLMQNAAERMQTLIQDLLAFSRLNMADRKFETTNLNIIIEEVKKEFKEAIAEKKAIVEVQEICEAKIIPFQFRQLMHNLIGNALKFSNPKIPPHIIIASKNIKYSEIKIARLDDKVVQTNLPPQKEYCHITISDNGIGFEKEFAEKIFEVFQKLHGQDEYAGTGIGLAIVKKIIENHNGIITATSELKKGTTFDIYIPT